jgi:hypothetical protein
MNATRNCTHNNILKAAALLIVFFLGNLRQSNAQEKNPADIRISVNLKNKPFEEALTTIQSLIPLKFAYSTELVQQQKNVSLTVSNMPLKDFLAALLQGTSLTYTMIGDQIVLHQVSLPAHITFSGFIKDAKNGESLIGASVFITGTAMGTFSNTYGFYSITVPFADSISLAVSYVGYKNISRRVDGRSNPALSFDLSRDTKQEEISKLVISPDKRENNVKKNQAALIELSSEMIASVPSIGGSDPVSSVQMLPGVQTGLDGETGYSVRGGNTGQNLVLLDEATLYNPSHLFGLVSIFNPYTIKNVSLMKGGFPAAYGDHISSVLDISMRDGNNQQFGGSIQAGTIASGISLYGPLDPGKSSFLIAARRSSVDWILRPIASQNYFTNYYFYDLNGKLNFRLSGKDRLFLSFYNGRDNNEYASDSTSVGAINYKMHFGNSAFALRWNHVYSRKLFSNTSIIYNRYHQFLSATQEGYFAQLYSGIRDLNAKTDFSYYPSPSHKISIGANYLYQTLLPALVSQKITLDSSLSINPDAIPNKIAYRLAFYASDDMKLGGRFKAYLGIRVPMYYKPGVQYINPEPRVSLLYLLSPASSVKVSYTEMHQYVHLVQSYNASFPAEIWIGSSQLVQPENSRELSLGFHKNFEENIFQTSVEFYYKQMGNQLLFKGSTSPVVNDSIEDQLIFGKAWSYGSELLIQKNRGKWTGWLSYTFAYAYQQFDSLNLGQSFPSAYDRRHSLYVSTSYAINKHWQASANFLLASGRAFTLNMNNGSSSQNTNPLYDEEDTGGSSVTTQIDNYRLSPYNRLDLSISYKKRRETNKRAIESEWIFSVYNVYAHRNTYFTYRAIDPSTNQPVANEVSFVPIIPSITFSLKF